MKIEGLKELDAALADLSKASARNALRKGLAEAAEPLAEKMRERAPSDPSTTGEDLKSSIGVGTKLAPRQAKLHRKASRNDKAFAEVFVGAGAVPQAHQQEFGNSRHAPQPFARPAWDEDKLPLLNRIRASLAKTIDKAVQRAARKAGKG